jgi:hypothetical protein
MMLFCYKYVVNSNIFYELKLFENAFISWLLIYCKSPLIVKCSFLLSVDPHLYYISYICNAYILCVVTEIEFLI